MTASENSTMQLHIVSAASDMKRIAIICPVHNEKDSLPYFLERLNGVRAQLKDRYAVEVVFVNNRSTDETLALILAARSKDTSLQVITQARNFGYQASLICGLTYAEADAYVVIDVDCEDPPEMILQFIDHWEKGADLVYGLRSARPEPALLVGARKLFYRLTRKVADWEFILDMAEFSLFSQRVREVVLSHKSTFPFVRSDLAFAGFERVGIPYTREARRFGATHYNLVRMVRFAVAGMLSASTFPLRAIAYIGLPLGLANSLYAVVAALAPSVGSALFTSFVALNLSFLVLAVAFLAIYLARVSKDVVGRPVFIADEAQSAVNRQLTARSDDRPMRCRAATGGDA
jgi:polyisoprenyl-phosphate glycosyltransferase